MFTGIVEDRGTVVRVDRQGQGVRLSLKVPTGLTEILLGDSINVNGACLTVVEKKGEILAVDVSSETLERTTFRDLREGEEVNLERAVRPVDRLGGHIVTGHVDGMGTIVEMKREGDFSRIRIQAPRSVMRYVVQKGSIAIDGVSLTVNECEGEEIQLTFIPFTLQKTTLLKKRVGNRINLEADIIGKYVEKLLGRKESGPKGLDQDFLREHGFFKE